MYLYIYKNCICYFQISELSGINTEDIDIAKVRFIYTCSSSEWSFR